VSRGAFSRFQGCKVARFQGCKVARVQSFKVARTQSFKGQGFKSFKVQRSKFQCFKGSKFKLWSPLFGLEVDGGGEVDGFGVVGDGDFFAVRGVAGDDVGLGPVEVPAIFNGDGSVRAGDDSGEGEAAVEIALVAAEEFAVRFGMGGDQDDHGSGKGLAVALDEAFDGR